MKRFALAACLTLVLFAQTFAGEGTVWPGAKPTPTPYEGQSMTAEPSDPEMTEIVVTLLRSLLLIF